MLAVWPAPADGPVIAALRAWPDIAPAPTAPPDRIAEILGRAERHGVAGFVDDAFRRASIPLPLGLERALDARRVARELDHEAHLAALGMIDRALARAQIRAVVLKGAPLAERLYPRPSARATSDTDLLVGEADLETAGAALRALGYAQHVGAEEARYRREHHHLHFAHAHGLPLELHFLAYRGFGSALPSAPLVAARAPFGSWTALGVLGPADEIVYLAVHAAAHRFVRLGWLFDWKLLVATVDDDTLEAAAERAARWGYERVFAFTARLAAEVLGVSRAPLRLLAARGCRVARSTTAEPMNPVLRSATRLVYTASLCDSAAGAVRYARRAAASHARRLLGTNS